MAEHGAGGRGFWNAKGKALWKERRLSRGSREANARSRGPGAVRERSCRGHDGSSGDGPCGCGTAAPGRPRHRCSPAGRGPGPEGSGCSLGAAELQGALGAVLGGGVKDQGLWVQFLGVVKDQAPGAVGAIYAHTHMCNF